MTKIAILNDVHIGARQDSVPFAEYQARFWGNTFFPYLRENQIRHCFILGDLFERRKFINFRSLSIAQEHLFQPLFNNGIETTITLGNHDIFYRESLEINAPWLLTRLYRNITVLEECHEIPEWDMLLVPWICKNNEQEVLTTIKKTKMRRVFGHFEIGGIEMEKGMIATGGLPISTFNRFDFVGSGHYHLKTQTGNITYFGTQYQLNWNDHGVRKGFHVFDTETGDLEFVPNPEEMYCRIEYTESLKKVPSDLTGKCVRIVLPRVRDEYEKDVFIQKITDQHPLELQIVDNHILIGDVSDDEESEDTENIENISGSSTLDMIRKIVKNTDDFDEPTQERVCSFVQQLHDEVTTE